MARARAARPPTWRWWRRAGRVRAAGGGAQARRPAAVSMPLVALGCVDSRRPRPQLSTMVAGEMRARPCSSPSLETGVWPIRLRRADRELARRQALERARDHGPENKGGEAIAVRARDGRASWRGPVRDAAPMSRKRRPASTMATRQPWRARLALQASVIAGSSNACPWQDLLAGVFGEARGTCPRAEPRVISAP